MAHSYKKRMSHVKVILTPIKTDKVKQGQITERKPKEDIKDQK
jgi:hypothetical protein